MAGSLIKPEHAIYTKRSEIRSVKDLEGRTLGSGSTGALLHTMWVAILRKYGVDERKVKFAEHRQPSDVFRAVAPAGVVDAGISRDRRVRPAGEVRCARPQGRRSVEELPEFTFQGAYASDKAIKEKRDAIVRTLAALTLGSTGSCRARSQRTSSSRPSLPVSARPGRRLGRVAVAVLPGAADLCRRSDPLGGGARALHAGAKHFCGRTKETRALRRRDRHVVGARCREAPGVSEAGSAVSPNGGEVGSAAMESISWGSLLCIKRCFVFLI